MAMTSDGTVWAGPCGDGAHGFGFGGLAAWKTDRGWQAVEPLAGTADEDLLISDATLLEAGRDDTLWALALTNTPDGVLSSLVAVSGGTVDVGVRETTGRHRSLGSVRDLALHPDESVWVAAADGVFVVDPTVAHDSALVAVERSDTSQ